jgi:Flp pilus assembly protein TadD
MDQFAAHLDRGWDLVSRGDLAGALLSAEKTVELDAQSPEAHNLMGYVLAAEGRSEEAVDHYRQAIDLDDTFVEAMLNAAEVLIHPLHDHEGALALIEDALELSEGDDEVADAMLLKFDAFLHAGDRDGAKRVIAALPDGPFENPNLDFLIGRARFETGDAEGAEPRIRAAIEREAEHAEARYYLGLVLEAKGDLRGATVAFLQTRDLDLAQGDAPWALPVEQFERRVQQALAALDEALRNVVDGALVVVSDLPGVEVLADGVDPRLGVLLDGLSTEKQAPRAERVFVYQRNIERAAGGVSELDEELQHSLEAEIFAAFPALAPAAGDDGAHAHGSHEKRPSKRDDDATN